MDGTSRESRKGKATAKSTRFKTKKQEKERKKNLCLEGNALLRINRLDKWRQANRKVSKRKSEEEGDMEGKPKGNGEENSRKRAIE